MVHVWLIEDSNLTGPAAVSRSRRDARVVQTLAHHLGVEEAELFVARAEGKKPALLRTDGTSPGDLSISHSGSWLGFAFFSGGKVGLDLERMRSISSVTKLSERYFVAAERAEIAAAVTPAARQIVTLQAWTRHEAALKAFGLPFSRMSNVLHQRDGEAWRAEYPPQQVRVEALEDLPGGLTGSIAYDAKVRLPVSLIQF